MVYSFLIVKLSFNWREAFGVNLHNLTNSYDFEFGHVLKKETTCKTLVCSSIFFSFLQIVILLWTVKEKNNFYQFTAGSEDFIIIIVMQFEDWCGSAIGNINQYVYCTNFIVIVYKLHAVCIFISNLGIISKNVNF